MEFYQTVMGKRFFEATIPSIAKNLEKIAKEMEAKSTRENSKENELMLQTSQSGWFYYKTSASTIHDARKEMEADGVNIDNLKIYSMVLRDKEGNDIDDVLIQ